jgi:L-fuculose-phosphate aldolase
LPSRIQRIVPTITPARGAIQCSSTGSSPLTPSHRPTMNPTSSKLNSPGPAGSQPASEVAAASKNVASTGIGTQYAGSWPGLRPVEDRRPAHNPAVDQAWATDLDAAKSAIVSAGRRLWQRGLIGAREGNISLRLDDGNLLVTASGADKGDLRPEDIVLTDLSGSLVGPGSGRTPSSEVRIHLRAYRDREDCRAVVHAHPPVATAFTLADEPFPDGVLPEASFVLGPVACVPFAFPGTEEVAEGLAPYLRTHKTFLLSHHGAMTLGSTLQDAVDRMETLERIASMMFHARLLGKLVPMPEWAAARLAHKMEGGLG